MHDYSSFLIKIFEALDIFEMCVSTDKTFNFNKNKKKKMRNCLEIDLLMIEI